MPIPKPVLQNPLTLAIITLLTPFLFPAYKMLGASITLGNNDSFSYETNIERTLSKLNTGLPSQGLLPDLLIDNNGANLNAKLSSSRLNRVSQSSLSVQSVVEALAQLKFEGKGSKNNKPNVPILPQIGYSDVLKGVYDFSPPNSTSNQPVASDRIVFRNNQFELTPVSSGLYGRSDDTAVRPTGPQVYGIVPYTNQSTLPKPEQASASGKVEFPTLNNSLVIRTPTPSAPIFASAMPIYPRTELSLSLQGTENTDEDADATNTNDLDSFGALEVTVNYRLLPEQILLTPLNLRDDPIFNNNLIRTNLAFTPITQSPLQQQLQQAVQDYSQAQSQQQERLQLQTQQVVEQAGQRQEQSRKNLTERRQGQRQR